MKILQRMMTGTMTLGTLMLATPQAPAAAAAAEKDAVKTFAPAFTEDAIDLAACQQYVNGAPAPADPWRVRRTFGLIPPPDNWQYHIWELPAGVEGERTTFGFLVVLKEPVAVGTLSVSPADLGEPRGSFTGGELFYLKGDAAGAPDPAKLDMWTKVAFASPAQHLRFSTLPAGTMVKALFYQDVRTKGPAQVIYLNAYRQRLQDVTSAATGSCDPKAGVKDPNCLPQGKGWSVDLGETAVSAEHPVSYTLTWAKPQTLSGIFLYSNADKFRILALAGKDGNPASAPADAWQPVAFTADWDNVHSWESWHYFYRWLSFPALETAAVRIEIIAADGKVPWITGLAAMTALGN